MPKCRIYVVYVTCKNLTQVAARRLSCRLSPAQYSALNGQPQVPPKAESGMSDSAVTVLATSKLFLQGLLLNCFFILYSTMTRARRPHGSTPSRSPKTTIVSRPVSTPRPRRPIVPSSSLKNSPPTPSVSVLLSQSLLTTDEWYKSSKTTKAYAAYVKSGKKFLESWEEEGSTDISSNEPEDPSTFAGAFDEINSKTPIALRLLTAYKCDHQGKGFATAEGLRSAFKLYFERYVNIYLIFSC